MRLGKREGDREGSGEEELGGGRKGKKEKKRPKENFKKDFTVGNIKQKTKGEEIKKEGVGTRIGVKKTKGRRKRR